MSADAPVLVHVPTDDGQVPVHVWTPPSGRGPGVLLLQEIFGVSAYIRSRAADLAALGYVVLAPEVYHRLDDAEVDESRPDVLEQAMSVVARLDWDRAVRDVLAVLAFLRARPDVEGGVGLLGFCFGGGLAFAVAAEAGERGPDALVSYYGSALPDLVGRAGEVRAPSLHHFGLADSFLDTASVARLQAALEEAGAQVETHEGAEHAFDNPMPAFHHAEASQRAWATTTAFLGERLSR